MVYLLFTFILTESTSVNNGAVVKLQVEIVNLKLIVMPPVSRCQLSQGDSQLPAETFPVNDFSFFPKIRK